MSQLAFIGKKVDPNLLFKFVTLYKDNWSADSQFYICQIVCVCGIEGNFILNLLEMKYENIQKFCVGSAEGKILVIG